jgi:hypothetical protein
MLPPFARYSSALVHFSRAIPPLHTLSIPAGREYKEVDTNAQIYTIGDNLLGGKNPIYSSDEHALYCKNLDTWVLIQLLQIVIY